MRHKKANTTHKRISFSLADVIFPERETVFANMTDEIEIIGKISFVSSNEKEKYAIIDVPGITIPIIVPQNKIKKLMEADCEYDEDKQEERQSYFEAI